MEKRVYMITDDDELALPRAILSSKEECAKWLNCSTRKVYELVVSSGSFNGFRVEIVFIHC